MHAYPKLEVMLAASRAGWEARRFPSLMRGSAVLFLWLAWGPCASWAQPARPVTSDQPLYRPDRILIQPRAGREPAALANLHANVRVTVRNRFPAFANIEVLQLPPGADPEKMIRAYEASGLVEVAEPDYWLYPAATPNDPRYADGSLWHLHNTGQSGGLVDADIDGPEGWDTVHSPTNLVVALVDTGVRYTHEDLAPNMWVNPGEIPGNNLDDDGNGYVDDVHGINAAANNGDPWDLWGHGTQVAGVLGAVGNNGLGVAGVAWRVKMMACRFYDDAGSGSLSDAVQCFDYARAQGAKVINASFVATVYASTFYTAINNCRSAGIIVVAAAGNDANNNDSTAYYPASFNLDNIVAVAATTRTDGLASYSNYGATSVDLAAPGSSIYTTHSTSDAGYVLNSGTSFSAPVVSGAMMLMCARYPTESYGQIITRVLAATDPLPSLQGKCVTGGRLNLAAALGPSVIADFTAVPGSGTPPLTVTFTDASFGTLAAWHWDFGEGTSSTEQHPVHTYASEGNFSVTLTVTSSAGLTSSKTRIVSVVANYEMAATSYSWVDPSGMPALTLSNEGVSPAQPLPFTFQFYGQSYSHVYVGANGLLGFESAGLTTAANSDLPDASLPNNLICPFWDDLSPATAGSVRIGTVGSAPNRRVVISWVAVRYAGVPPADYTFQAILEESTHQIVFQYESVSPGRGGGTEGRSATVGIENGGGTVAARYSYNGSTLLANQTAIRFIPSTAGGMAVSPAAGLDASGTVGGPFTPESQVYTITNTGNGTLSWTVSKAQEWISVSADSGVLEPGQSTAVTVSLNPAAAALAAGSYYDSVAFVNTGNGVGNTTRTVSLAVNGTTGILAVTPESALEASGYSGGPFAPLSQLYTLVNNGDASLTWTASHTQPWVNVLPASGSLAAGGSATVSVAIDSTAAALAPGTHADTVAFVNTSHGLGDTTRSVLLTVLAVGKLEVLPVTDFLARGHVGAFFLPGSQTYMLTNSGTTNLTWSATRTATWLSLSSDRGELAPGETATITAALTAEAELLATNAYADVIHFSNLSNGNGSATRTAELTVTALPWLQAAPRSVEGWFQVTVKGAPGFQYALEASADFVNWTAMTTNQAGLEGTVTFADPDSLSLPRRFYRARPVAP